MSLWSFKPSVTFSDLFTFQSAWEAVEKSFIDEKREKLGVETGTGSSMIHIHAPHARAASVSCLVPFPVLFRSSSAQISSPADPALLFFKLNKLQQTQNPHSHSASVSPQPMFSKTPLPPAIILYLLPVTASPASLRHGHSLSMVAAPFIPLRLYTTFNNNSISFNSFGSLAVRSPVT